MIIGYFYDGIQVLIKDNKYYTNQFEWKELDKPYTTIQPPTCKKCEFDGTKWVVLEEYEKLDNLTQIKNNEDLTNENKQLWQTVEFLLKIQGLYQTR